MIEIDIAMAQGRSINSLSKKYGLYREPLNRHKKKGHVMATAAGEVWDMSRPRDQLMVTAKRLIELLGAVEQKIDKDKDIDVGTVRTFVGLLREHRATLEAMRKATDTSAPRQTTSQIIAEVMGVVADATTNAIEIREAIASMLVARGMIEAPTPADA